MSSGRASKRLELILTLTGAIAFAMGASQLIRYQRFQAKAAVLSPIHSSMNRSPVLGRLDIPKLNLSIPILDNDDAVSLSFSAGHIPGTSAIGSLGNAGIAGHRDTSFRALPNIGVGDVIETHTGQDVAYVVKTIRIVKPTDTSLLRESSSPLLTLVTCYPFDYIGSAPFRYVIQAEMTDYQAATVARRNPSK
jgi:sortase A